MQETKHAKPALGSLFAGIGGFDLGFHRAGWETRWQVEINPVARLVLADRFPNAKRYEDIKQCGSSNLAPVECIAAGFPCQDISASGSSRKNYRDTCGLKGKRSSLFFEVIRILREIQPPWVVLENVPALLHTNDSQDIQQVIQSLAQLGYVGYFRVLDAQYFGVPQKRRRIFLVAGLGRYPPIEYLADAGQLVSLPCSLKPEQIPRPADAFASCTLQATNAPGRYSIGSELFIAQENGWNQMLKRARASWNDGLPKGLDEPNLAQAYHAGNAVVPQIAEWIARLLNPFQNRPPTLFTNQARKG